MRSKLTYAPVIEFSDNDGSLVELADNFGRDLRKREIPACYIRRTSEIDLAMATRISEVLIKHNVLPVVELLPGDPVLDFRILFESCVLGTVEAVWKSDSMKSDPEGFYELVYNAGRHRLPLDLNIKFTDGLPAMEIFQPFVDKIGELADKYGHVQVVRLTGIPENNTAESHDYLRTLARMCPRSQASVSPSLWIENEDLRRSITDVGLVAVELEGSSISKFMSGEISELEAGAESIGLPVGPRLPLVPRFYAKGWYSFEVGKVLDHWTGRKVFNAYRDRPEWLAD